MASQTGMMRGMTQASCLPRTAIFRGFPWTSIVSCSRAMEAMGLQAARITISCPVVIPASTPPAWLLLNPPGPMGSLLCEPFIRAASNPAPISTPFTVPMPMRAAARSASILSKTGSPSPAGQPVTRISTMPPRLSPSRFASSSFRSILFAASASGHSRRFAPMASLDQVSMPIPPSSTVQPRISIPSRARILRATAPAATRAAVSRPEARPPPRWSRMPYFFRYV